MKTRECIKKTARLLTIGIKKATSYKVVKSRLGHRFYNDEFLQARMQDTENKEEKTPPVSYWES